MRKTFTDFKPIVANTMYINVTKNDPLFSPKPEKKMLRKPKIEAESVEIGVVSLNHLVIGKQIE